jgi:site-specific DNA-methyltransferase (adenine-specific)
MTVELHLGDNLDVMPGMEENSVDTVITDPPYGLSAPPDIAAVMRAWIADEMYEHNGGGFMGKEWDRFVPSPRYWKEVYRVIKPGGMCLVFAGTRTVDLMGIALRFAGFEIRDTLMWLYGSG